MRTGHWFDRLQAVVSAHEGAQWQRGACDCGTFAADCLIEIGATDAMGLLRGNYTSKSGMLRMMSRLGYAGAMDVAEKWCAEHGYPEIEPKFCQCGDLGFTEDGVACIRMPQGFVAMAEAGGIYIVNPVKAWAVEWE